MDAPKNERTGPTDSKVPTILGIIAAAVLVSIVVSNFLPPERSPPAKPPDQKASEAALPAKEEPADAPRKKMIRAGERAEVTTAFFGCKNDADISRILKLGRSGDSEAAARIAEAKDCKQFEKGVAGDVEHITVWAGISCIREKGEPDCYWFPDQFLDAR